MKKLVMMLVCMFAVHTMVMADNDKPIEVSQLPAKAQTFIKTYFKDHKVAMAKLESGMLFHFLMSTLLSLSLVMVLFRLPMLIRVVTFLTELL